uniref:Uncharacterized protein n=1 Tax=Opuntia streptacantha TaxID=393608 RepID=A0A7C8ZH73_OPUST
MTPKKKKKEPPDPLLPVILTPSAPDLSLNSRWLDRFGVQLTCPVLDCSSLGRCLTLVKPPWLIRNLTVLQLKPSIASVDDLIIQVGFVGAALGSSIGALNVARSAADGVFVALWCHLKWALNLFMVYQLSTWHLLPHGTSTNFFPAYAKGSKQV